MSTPLSPKQFPLSDDDKKYIDFERANPTKRPVKDSAIYETFGHSPTRYYQKLNGMVGTPAAHEYDAGTMGRLHRSTVDSRGEKWARGKWTK